jgi:hypothetical protein
MTEIQGGEIEEVDDQKHFGPPEMGANEEHDPAKLQEIVENEVTSYCSGGVDIFTFVREEVPDVANLEDE